ncbi:hypothetical protein IRJ41_021065, partial [Triplophysa rosa]
KQNQLRSSSLKTEEGQKTYKRQRILGADPQSHRKNIAERNVQKKLGL